MLFTCFSPTALPPGQMGQDPAASEDCTREFSKESSAKASMEGWKGQVPKRETCDGLPRFTLKAEKPTGHGAQDYTSGRPPWSGNA